MVADKFFSDEYLRNTDYAIVGGIKSEEVNELETELLLMINFEVNVEEEALVKYIKKLNAFGEQQRKIVEVTNLDNEEHEVIPISC